MQPIIAANWKMYKTAPQARATAQELKELIAGKILCQVVVFAPFTALAAAREGLGNLASAYTGAQDVYPAAEGAFTGEISPAMLLDAGCTWVLLGHSERRHIIGETDELLALKLDFALRAGLRVMLCIGETLAEREAGRLKEVLLRQLKSALAKLPADLRTDMLAIAYEPVWAIGTGKTAQEADVLEAHGMVRAIMAEISVPSAAAWPILYGGSVKPENAANLLALDNVNGLLVGGASLQADSFAKIVRAWPV
jgi:triosephosphate isomerase